jgi:hypothetical protein
VVNIPEDISDKNSKDFSKVFIRRRCYFLRLRCEGSPGIKTVCCEEDWVGLAVLWAVMKTGPPGGLTVLEGWMFYCFLGMFVICGSPY